MLTAFDQVTLWRQNFQPGSEIVALIGHQDQTPIPHSDLDVKAAKKEAIAGAAYTDMQDLFLHINEQTVLFFYCGNVTASKNLFEKYPVNTDDKPIIEYKTPLSLHQDKSKGSPQFVADKFAAIVDQLLENTPPMADPMLADRGPENRNLPLAGAAFHKAWIARVLNDQETWIQNWEVFKTNWTEPEISE
jgi:hypothetical protein